MVTVYKVVRSNMLLQPEGKRPTYRLVSLQAESLAFDDIVTYIPYRWVSARVGPIFAYTSYEAAYMAYRCCNICELWQAEAKVYQDRAPRHILRMCQLQRHVEEFWTTYKLDELTFDPSPIAPATFLGETTMPILPNTILCKQIKLVDEIDPITHRQEV